MDLSGRLAQMVERALWKFSPQREVVQILPALWSFCMEFISINTRLQALEVCYGIKFHKCGTSSLRNMRWNLDKSQRAKIEGSLQYGQKEQSEEIGPCKYLPSNTVPPYRREDAVVESNAQETSGVWGYREHGRKEEKQDWYGPVSRLLWGQSYQRIITMLDV